MKKKVYNKLVRDRIPSIIANDGITCKYHEANDKEFEEMLYEKLEEELDEFIENPSAEEMADILEVLESIRKFHKIDLDLLKYKKESKMVNRGGFESKIILEWTKGDKIERDGSHVHINNGDKKLKGNFKTSGIK